MKSSVIHISQLSSCSFVIPRAVHHNHSHDLGRDSLAQSLDRGREEVLSTSRDHPNVSERGRCGRAVWIGATDLSAICQSIHLPYDWVDTVGRSVTAFDYRYELLSPRSFGGLFQGEVTIVRPACLMVRHPVTQGSKFAKLTFLNELEPVGDAALVAGEEQATAVESLLLLSLGAGYFRAKLNTSSNNSVALNRDSEFFQIGTRIGFPNVSSERAKLLEVPLCREMEIVVSDQEK